MLRWMNSNTLRYQMRNKCIHRKLEAALAEDKIWENYYDGLDM